MRRKTFTALLLAAGVPFVHAADPALLTEARQALAESIPQVAVQKLKTLLAKPGVPAADRRAAQLELGAAYLAAENDEAALAAVQTLADAGDAAAQLLRAQVFARAGRWKEALALFEELAAPAEAPAAARLGLVESRVVLGKTAEAVAALDAFVREQPRHPAAALRLVALLIDTSDARRARAVWAGAAAFSPADKLELRFLEGRLLLLEGRAGEALAVFDELLRAPERLAESVLFGAALGSSDATLRLSGADTADTVIEKFIGRYPGSRYLDGAFQRLGQIYALQPNPSETVLRQWTKDGVPRVAALARFHTARLRVRVKNPDGALKAINGILEHFPDSPLVPGARLLQADLLLAKGDLTGAVGALEEAERRTTDDAQRAEVELRRALVHYRQGEWLLAANSFRGAAERSTRLRPNAAYGAALAALALGNHERFTADYQVLNTAAPDSPLCRTLILEQGLARARTGDPRAAETLGTFLHHYPNHSRQSEARLALAELAFAAADLPGAARYLRVANESAPSRATAERAAYFAIFLGDETSAQPADEQAIQRATAFLRDYPHSDLLPEVRMKLGQLHVRARDHASAETQFTLLAQEQPTGPYAEAALFLAGQSAMRSINPGAVDRALALFDQVVKRDGTLKLHARQQQAIVQSKLGRESEAVLLYDAILAATPVPDAELRFAALCGKGDSLLILGRQDPKQLEAAVAAFDQLATMPGVSPSWRNQALYKKGRGLSTLSRTDEALAAWYDVLEKTAPEGRDFFWFYKAGFDAADVFRLQGQWKSAVGIYDKMAKVPGPRAAEARERAAQLRVEKFLP
jgi:tetratricopeptide (TPR) repeat protein